MSPGRFLERGDSRSVTSPGPQVEDRKDPVSSSSPPAPSGSTYTTRVSWGGRADQPSSNTRLLPAEVIWPPLKYGAVQFGHGQSVRVLVEDARPSCVQAMNTFAW